MLVQSCVGARWKLCSFVLVSGRGSSCYFVTPNSHLFCRLDCLVSNFSYPAAALTPRAVSTIMKRYWWLIAVLESFWSLSWKERGCCSSFRLVLRVGSQESSLDLGCAAYQEANWSCTVLYLSSANMAGEFRRLLKCIWEVASSTFDAPTQKDISDFVSGVSPFSIARKVALRPIVK